MSKDGLNAFVGVYKQNDGNTFVVSLENGSLYLKTSEIHKEKCTLRADGLFGVENTKALLNFQIGPSGQAQTLTFILPDRQTVATRSRMNFVEQSFFSKFKELIIALVIFFAFVGMLLVASGPIQNACEKGIHPIFCKIASMNSRFFSTTKRNYDGEEALASYKQITEDTKEACEQGDQDSCLLMAKNFWKISSQDKAYKILEESCLKAKHSPSCQQLKEFYIEDGKIDRANSLLNETCNEDTPQSCYDLAWNLERNKESAEATKYFSKACDYGVEESCFHLGKFYLQVERLLSQDYLKKACDRYHRQACVLLKKVQSYFEHKTKCLEEKSGQSCFLMASFEQDYGLKSVARKAYEQSCEYGYKLACNIVKDLKAREKLRESGQKVDTL